MACAIASAEAAIIVAEINGPMPEHWKNCGIYSPEADAS
jgi:hypothetical protein